MGVPTSTTTSTAPLVNERAAQGIGELVRSVSSWIAAPQFLAGLGLALVLFFIAILLRWRRDQPQAVTLSLPFGLGSMTYNTTPTERVAAWKLHVQLVTRKAAIPFDEDHDLIVEVYDSLFELFTITRQLLLDLPLRDFDPAEGIASLMLRVQNDGVRPHLTRWQADFRRWWDRTAGLDENADKSPQEIQRQYPRYAALIADLKMTNTELSKFADELLTIAKGQQPKREPPVPKPVAPVQ